jgi:hypothetical protein
MTEKRMIGAIAGVFIGTVLMVVLWAFQSIAAVAVISTAQPTAHRPIVGSRQYGHYEPPAPYGWPQQQPPRSYPAGPTGVPKDIQPAPPQTQRATAPWFARTGDGPATRTPLPTWTDQPIRTAQPTATYIVWTLQPTRTPTATATPTATDCNCLVITNTPTP